MSVKILEQETRGSKKAPAPKPDELSPLDQQKSQDPTRGSIEDSIPRRGQEEKGSRIVDGESRSGWKLEKDERNEI